MDLKKLKETIDLLTRGSNVPMLNAIHQLVHMTEETPPPTPEPVKTYGGAVVSVAELTKFIDEQMEQSETDYEESDQDAEAEGIRIGEEYMLGKIRWFANNRRLT
jgi:hypothetical protein